MNRPTWYQVEGAMILVLMILQCVLIAIQFYELLDWLINYMSGP